MHIVVTGAAGLVGRRTLKHLLSQKHTVTAIDIIKLPVEVLDTLSPTQKEGLTSFTVDLAKESSLEDIIQQTPRKIEGVIHLGGIPNPDKLDARTVYNTNVTGTYNVLQTCAKLGINRVVQASSVNAYGLSFTPREMQYFELLPLTENSPSRPMDPYSTSKLCAEIQAAALCRRYPNLRIASLRFHMCKENYEEASAAARPGSLWGWVSYEASARACLLALTGDQWSGHEVLNIAADEICWEGGVHPDERFNGERLDSLSLLKGYWKGQFSSVDQEWWRGFPRRGFFDTSKAERLLGWRHNQ